LVLERHHDIAKKNRDDRFGPEYFIRNFSTETTRDEWASASLDSPEQRCYVMTKRNEASTVWDPDGAERLSAAEASRHRCRLILAHVDI
jgi:hypothetical protein